MENSWENDGATSGTWMIYGQFMGKSWKSGGNMDDLLKDRRTIM